MLAELNEDHNEGIDKSNELLQQLTMRPQPFSTKARDNPNIMMENGKKVMFPGEADMGDDEEINDISGIVNDISNIEDTSFQIAIDALNIKKLGVGAGGNGGKPRNLQINTCKLVKFNLSVSDFYFISHVICLQLCQIALVTIKSKACLRSAKMRLMKKPIKKLSGLLMRNTLSRLRNWNKRNR